MKEAFKHGSVWPFGSHIPATLTHFYHLFLLIVLS